MIIQGSNHPIMLYMTEGMTEADIADISVAICFHNASVRSNKDKIIKRWGKSDLSFSGNIITCALTQEETMQFDPGTATIEIKWLDNSGETHICDLGTFDIVARCDETVLGGES